MCVSIVHIHVETAVCIIRTQMLLWYTRGKEREGSITDRILNLLTNQKPVDGPCTGYVNNAGIQSQSLGDIEVRDLRQYRRISLEVVESVRGHRRIGDGYLNILEASDVLDFPVMDEAALEESGIEIWTKNFLSRLVGVVMNSSNETSLLGTGLKHLSNVSEVAGGENISPFVAARILVPELGQESGAILLLGIGEHLQIIGLSRHEGIERALGTSNTAKSGIMGRGHVWDTRIEKSITEKIENSLQRGRMVVESGQAWVNQLVEVFENLFLVRVLHGGSGEVGSSLK
ncbi:hypothetical protein HG530_001912 [Fusarium avenaceum]|nr:hypothetical protein HG530_001912 [Fusarium avenaceum]